MTLLGGPFDYIDVFLGGVVVSFTPCVFPLVPVIISFIGIKAGMSKFKGFLLSLAYVTGIAVTYCALGLFASLTGKIFGTISSHPATYISVGIIIILFGVSLFDVFNISLPRLITLPNIKEKNYFSIFILGISSGLIIGPCTAPALGAILLYLATKKNIFYGTTLLLSFAYGMGLILILSGTFSSILVNLPKSGKWMSYVKKAFALILVATGVYFIYTGIRRI